ncbi:MAG: proteasome subunit alpha, partial [Pseudonocardiaceae bacterium]
DAPDFVVMGGQAEVISTALKESFRQNMDTAEAVAIAVAALSSASTSVNGAGKRTLGVGQLEVAVLDRSRPHRAFRRITGAALTALLPGTDTPAADPNGDVTQPDQGTDADGTNGGTAGPSGAD